MHIKLSLQCLKIRKRASSQVLIEIDPEASSLSSSKSEDIWTIENEQTGWSINLITLNIREG